MTDRTFHKRFSVPAKCGVAVFALLTGYFFWVKVAIIGILLAIVIDDDEIHFLIPIDRLHPSESISCIQNALNHAHNDDGEQQLQFRQRV